MLLFQPPQDRRAVLRLLVQHLVHTREETILVDRTFARIRHALFPAKGPGAEWWAFSAGLGSPIPASGRAEIDGSPGPAEVAKRHAQNMQPARAFPGLPRPSSLS